MKTQKTSYAVKVGDMYVESVTAYDLYANDSLNTQSVSQVQLTASSEDALLFSQIPKRLLNVTKGRLFRVKTTVKMSEIEDD